MCYKIGQNWKNQIHTDELPESSELHRHMMNTYHRQSDTHNYYKNAWVFTGVDSIIKVFKRAKENFELMKNGQSLPRPPEPPPYLTLLQGR